MAKDKKLVEAITSMDTDFAQWYTDVVKKAELIAYSSVKGCMIIKPARLCDLGKYPERVRPQIQRNRCGKCLHANVHTGELAPERKKTM